MNKNNKSLDFYNLPVLDDRKYFQLAIKQKLRLIVELGRERTTRNAFIKELAGSYGILNPFDLYSKYVVLNIFTSECIVKVDTLLEIDYNPSGYNDYSLLIVGIKTLFTDTNVEEFKLNRGKIFLESCENFDKPYIG